MTDRLYRVELTVSFLERLDAVEEFLTAAEARFADDDLLAELRQTVIPSLGRYPRIGRRYLDQPPRSVEALTLLAGFAAGEADALREYVTGDYLILYTQIEAEAVLYLLSIRHQRELAFSFSRP